MNRALLTWMFVFVMIAVGLIIWGISQPVTEMLTDTMINTARSTGSNTTTAERGITIIQGMNVLWIGIYIIALLVFGFLMSTHREGISDYRSPSGF